MKIFLLYFIFILLNNCSFDNKSGIWKNENNIDKNQKDTFKQFKNLSTSIDPFNETIEISFNLGVDPKQADQMVRGVVNLPEGTGKTVKVAVFARDSKAKEAEAAGADIVGSDDLAETVKSG